MPTRGSRAALVLQHVPFEGPAWIATWLQSRAWRVDTVRFWAGDPLPSPHTYDLVVVMGGPMGIHDTRAYPWLVPETRFIERVVALERPVLGLCLGAQLLAHAMGARVYRGPQKEIGWWPVEFARFPAPGTPVDGAAGSSGAAASSGSVASEGSRRTHGLSRWLGSLPARATVFHWHGDTFDLPAGSRRIAWSPATPNQGFVAGGRVVGLQFHLESTAASVRALARACAGDIEDGTYQSDRRRAPGNLVRGVRTHAGTTRRILDALLDDLTSHDLQD